MDDPGARSKYGKDEAAADDRGAAESRSRSQHIEPRERPPAIDQRIGDHDISRID